MRTCCCFLIWMMLLLMLCEGGSWLIEMEEGCEEDEMV